MRLTLRTLLAYLDDLLDPADAVELGKRIDENKFASELVNRIRTRMRLLRLSAPKVDGRGIGLDANTVAEYLDNTLPADLVPDLEKICLESDIHLAEVASCHQILAAVQDHPAPFDPELKERVFHALTTHVERADTGAENDWERPTDAPHLAAGPLTDSHATPDAAPAPALSPARETRSQGILPLLATVAAMFLVAMLALRALGPFDRMHPVARWVGLGPTGAATSTVARNDGSGDTRHDGSSTSTQSGDDSATANHGAAAGPLSGDSADGAMPVGNGDEPADTSPPAAPDEPDVLGRRGQPDQPSVPERADPVLPPGEARAVAPRPADADAKPGVPAVAPADVAPNEPRTPVRSQPAPGNVGRDIGRPGADNRPPNGEPKPGSVAPEPSNIPSAPTATVEAGRFLSENHILARRASQDGLWYALPRGARLGDGDHLVSLPIYRPQFVLATGVQVMMVGEGAVGLRSLDANESASVELVVESGRLLVASSGKVDSVLPLNLGGLAGVVRFADVDAELAIHVHRYLAPGGDPAAESPLTVTQMSARAGRIAWHPMDGEEETIPAGHVRIQVAGQVAQIELAGYPSWADPKSVSKLDRDASEHLGDQISPTRPLMLSLDEQLDFRRTEVRSLAARCLGQLGQYSALVRELASEQQHSYWDEALDGLRAGLTRSPEDAAAVLTALHELGKEDGERAYRLVRDFSPEQLQQGGASQLVEYLDHSTLAIRVLAYENLRRITGSTQFYRPEAPPDRRKTTVQSWRKRLADGLIVYKTPPTPVPEREPPPKTEAEPASRSPLPE